MGKYIVLFFFCFIPFMPEASADSLRCNGQLASLGDTKADIVDICGEPMSTDSFCEPNTINNGPQGIQNGDNNVQHNVSIQSCTQVDVWTYNPGKGKLMTHLYFSQGQLRTIRYGNRVK